MAITTKLLTSLFELQNLMVNRTTMDWVPGGNNCRRGTGQIMTPGRSSQPQRAMVTVHIKTGQVLHTTQMIEDSFAQAG